MNDRCGVLPELALVSFPVAQQLVQGGNYNSLQLQLIDGPRMAFMLTLPPGYCKWLCCTNLGGYFYCYRLYNE